MSAPNKNAPATVGPAARPLAHFLAETARRSASDLLLVALAPPTIFSDGHWMPLTDLALSPDDVTAAVESALSPAQRKTLQRSRDLDFAIALPGVGRFRVNAHYQRGSLAAACRAIPDRIPPFDALGLPQHVLRFADLPNGLLLITGGTGQGKSTTLAAMINHMNQTRSAHVITIEDPVEFGFSHGRCLIEQREIGGDSPTFSHALRHILRQRPDIILIGEMRDQETTATALTAAETGHLVLASLHTSSAAQTLSRIVDIFPGEKQSQIRIQLAASLRAILCQTLLCDRLNGGLVPATEILCTTPAVRRALRDNETHLIYGMMETGRAAGMQTLEQSLAEQVLSGRVAPDDALAAASEPARLEKLLGLAAAVHR